MIEKTIKTRKKPVTKRKRTIKKKPAIQTEETMFIHLPPKRRYAIKVMAEEPRQPKAVFYGTEYEKIIMDICAENKFPFDYRRAKIDGNVADFCNRTKRLIIEVYNPDRSHEEVQARLRAFLVQRFKTKYITKDKFSMRGWRKSCVVSIKRFLE